jgi:hypothetical protein
MKEIISKALVDSIDYSAYGSLVSKLVKEGGTTGPNQSEALDNYTKLNASRMRRWDKMYNPSVDFQRVAKNKGPAETWLVITEAWCGDAAHNLPFMAKMADLMQQVSLRIVLRDENPELMDLFLTNGARSIPKLLRLDENLEVIGTWGPRPATLQAMVMENKKSQAYTYAEFSEVVQTWYNKNKGQEIEQEFIALLEESRKPIFVA